MSVPLRKPIGHLFIPALSTHRVAASFGDRHAPVGQVVVAEHSVTVGAVTEGFWVTVGVAEQLGTGP